MEKLVADIFSADLSWNVKCIKRKIFFE